MGTPMSLKSLVLGPLEGVRRYVGLLAWSPMVELSRGLVLSLFKKIEKGQLSIVDTDGQSIICGQAEYPAAGPRTELRVQKEAFWVRMLLFTDMGFAESYMLGEVSCSNLTEFFELFILNRKRLSNGTNLVSSLSTGISGLARSTNTLANSRLNISAHYDISNDMFAAFLSPDMTYSCAIWLSKKDLHAPRESLEEAQYRKLHRTIANAHIKQSDHVLEIGCGWGSFAIEAVRKTGCRVTTITLSREQKVLAEQRIGEAGFTDNIEVLLCDYRALPTPKEGLYDKIVSIEMLEAVGKEYLDTYFECIHKLLKPDGGIGVFHCITIPETRYESYQKSTDFIREYIFPGGHLPSVSQLVRAITTGSSNSLIIDSIENIGPHYARTLRCWKENFLKSFETRIKPALLREHDGMTKKDVELFRRKWEYYFTYCEAAFKTNTLGDMIITVSREGTTELAENIIL